MKPVLKVEGVNEVLKDLEGLARKGREASVRALNTVADRIVPKAKARTPVDDEDGGDLRDSVRRTKATVNAASGMASVAVIAGGAPLEASLGARRSNIYAIIQHDDPTQKHDDGEAFFLESAVKEEHPSLPDELEKELGDLGGAA